LKTKKASVCTRTYKLVGEVQLQNGKQAAATICHHTHTHAHTHSTLPDNNNNNI